MINLLDSKYSEKQLVDSELILQKVSDYNIFKYYYPELEVGCNTNSPLRKDKNPSFSVYWSKKFNRLMFKDFANGERGDVFVFLTKYLNLNYYEVLCRIVVDFNLDDFFYIKEELVKPATIPVIYTDEYVKALIKDAVRLQVKVREFEDYDYKYWGSYGISKSTLIKYRVKAISHIFINEDIIIADKLAYVYVELKDNVLRMKIYQPYSRKLKWINNLVEGTLSGWSQMKPTGDKLIIASSLKDAMCLHDLGFVNVIAPQTENYIHKQHIIDHLKSRFKQIYIFYDNDNAGITASNRMCELYNLKPLSTMTGDFKDPSDYYRGRGREELLKCIYKQL